ncbi:uncharacterized protein UV8b_00457 [Ustilaginoidea virens]|uniref:Inhibitor I9 domain-containing protein n=1 Tax=Ustilaginoidea virens TaxID=1159556 RepID=A0A8E5MDH7_USTVR|nr:uncharacterized protein UV8b_00457 [Ustilaginoidea virens]QUC16216.1 hypothetical protein UV8b_00457 [Ustilaginoidea virens]
MRLLPYLALVLGTLPPTIAVDQKKSAIIYFDDTVPDSILAEAKSSIVAAGGKITHHYTLIKGFAVIAPEKALETVQAWGTQHSMKETLGEAQNMVLSTATLYLMFVLFRISRHDGKGVGIFL